MEIPPFKNNCDTIQKPCIHLQMILIIIAQYMIDKEYLYKIESLLECSQMQSEMFMGGLEFGAKSWQLSCLPYRV